MKKTAGALICVLFLTHSIGFASATIEDCRQKAMEVFDTFLTAFQANQQVGNVPIFDVVMAEWVISDRVNFENIHPFFSSRQKEKIAETLRLYYRPLIIRTKSHPSASVIRGALGVVLLKRQQNWVVARSWDEIEEAIQDKLNSPGVMLSHRSDLIDVNSPYEVLSYDRSLRSRSDIVIYSAIDLLRIEEQGSRIINPQYLEAIVFAVPK